MTDKQTTPFELFEQADAENIASYEAIKSDKYYMNTTKIMNVLKKQNYLFEEAFLIVRVLNSSTSSRTSLIRSYAFMIFGLEIE